MISGASIAWMIIHSLVIVLPAVCAKLQHGRRLSGPKTNALNGMTIDQCASHPVKSVIIIHSVRQVVVKFRMDRNFAEIHAKMNLVTNSMIVIS